MTTAPFNDTTTFKAKPIVSPQPTNVAGGIVTRSRTNRRPDDTQTATDELFETDYVGDSNPQVTQLRELMARHKEILSVTNRGTAVMQRTFLKLQQLLSGEFLYAYTWDRQWFSRVTSSYPVDTLHFSSWDELMGKLEDVLSYVEERQQYGYWYPSKRNGKACKDSLSDFIAKPMRNGNWWSPFMEIACGDCLTPSMYRASFGKPVCKILDEILSDVWFDKDFNTMLKFYKGVAGMRKWYDNVSRGFKGNGDNYWMASFTGFLEQVKMFNEEKHGVGPSFIGPWSNKWGVFKSWMYSARGVTI